jgi:hypothetical protein
VNRTFLIGGIGLVVIVIAIALSYSVNQIGGDSTRDGGLSTNKDTAARQSEKEQLPPDEPSPSQITKKFASPQFDVVRVNPQGDAVIAGRAELGAVVTVLDGERIIGVVTADERGEWVLLPKEPLPPGSRELTVVQQVGEGKTMTSDANIVLVVPKEGEEIAGRSVGGEPQPLVLKVPREGRGSSRVLQAPSVSDLTGSSTAGVSVDVVDYDDQGKFALAGRGEVGSEVYVYLDNTLVGRVMVDADGLWQLEPKRQIEPGIYRLRADQHKDGAVIARVELPFSRSAPVIVLSAGSTVIVQPGNSLWRIARRTLGRGMAFTTIYEANSDQIRDPDLIYPGQIFSVPNVK